MVYTYHETVGNRLCNWEVPANCSINTTNEEYCQIFNFVISD